MEGKDSLHYRVSIKPNTGFLKGLIKLTNFWLDIMNKSKKGANKYIRNNNKNNHRAVKTRKIIKLVMI